MGDGMCKEAGKAIQQDHCCCGRCTRDVRPPTSHQIVADGLSCSDNSTTQQIEPTFEEHQGGRGRPKKVIKLVWLRDALGPRRALKKARLASLANVHRHTLRARMKEAGIFKTHSRISEDDLDAIVKDYRVLRPRAGYRFVRGHLLGLGLMVQRHRILSSIRRVDSVGRTLRRHAAIVRRQYKVSRPHALWHMDGHHKLIRWGIVVHAFVDGHSRLVRWY